MRLRSFLVSKTHDQPAVLLERIIPHEYLIIYFFVFIAIPGSRCLDPETNMLLLVRVNPAAEWIIRPRVV